jgi:16S rRNA C1402 N4-methylase RsmH
MSDHVPVLLAEVIAALSPRDGAHYIDGTSAAAATHAPFCKLQIAACSVSTATPMHSRAGVSWRSLMKAA